jgi:hypothetical protein
MKTKIWITFQKHGLHRYPLAPTDVSYLRDTHRHLFKFRVDITVHHDDREIEFHQFQNWCMSLYEGKELSLDFKSCEMIAADLLAKIKEQYNCEQRDISVDVSEDGECGATVSLEGKR